MFLLLKWDLTLIDRTKCPCRINTDDKRTGKERFPRYFDFEFIDIGKHNVDRKIEFFKQIFIQFYFINLDLT